jgi:hypothetical protein
MVKDLKQYRVRGKQAQRAGHEMLFLVQRTISFRFVPQNFVKIKSNHLPAFTLP